VKDFIGKMDMRRESGSIEPEVRLKGSKK
jgi:hypothetical protein